MHVCVLPPYTHTGMCFPRIHADVRVRSLLTRRVRVRGKVEDWRLKRLASGVTIDGVHYGRIFATKDDPRGVTNEGANSWVTVSIREGKNQEVRKAMDHIGLTVSRLIRVSFGPIQLEGLRNLQFEPLNLAERTALSQALATAPKPSQRRTRENKG